VSTGCPPGRVFRAETNRCETPGITYKYDSNGNRYLELPGSKQPYPDLPSYYNPLDSAESARILNTPPRTAAERDAVLANERITPLMRNIYAQAFPASSVGGSMDGINFTFGGEFGGGTLGGGLRTGDVSGLLSPQSTPAFQFFNDFGGEVPALTAALPSSLNNAFSVYGNTIPLYGSSNSFLPTGGNSASVGYSNTGGFSSSFAPDLGGYGGLLTGAALAGGLGLLLGGDNATKTTQTTNLPPPTAAELALLGINMDLATSQLGAYRQALALQGSQNQLVEQLFQEQLGIPQPTPEEVAQAKTACDAQFSGNVAANQHCQNSLYNARVQQLQQERQQQQQAEAQSRVDRLGQLNSQADQVGQFALADAQQGSQPLRQDQLDRIRGSADLSIQSGLSDLTRFRDEGLDAIRMNSATRGLRPGDTPITNKYHDLASEVQRSAQNFVGNIRAQQLNSELTLPFQESQIRSQNLGLAGDLALRRAALEEQLRQNAQNARLGLASNVQATGLGLATGLNPSSAFNALTSARTSSGSTTQTSTPGGASNLATTLGGIGGLLTGLGNLGLFGGNQQQRTV
jgi:hypothetical protein